MRLLVLEDEKDVADALLHGLSQNGYAVDVAETGSKGLEAIEVNEYDLLILDLNLPDMDGLDICRQAREKHPSLLILILTARGKQKDIVTGLDYGADDYLIKPFHLQELLARIRALFRRDLRVREPVLKAQNISVDPVEKVVWKSEHRIQLTRKEFGILEYLLRHPNEVISQEELLEHVWGTMTNVFSNTVRVHIQSLREKLADNSETPQYIETVIGTGYRFICPERDSSAKEPQKEGANE
jgi:DNA-binding response OmpR family regulator